LKDYAIGIAASPTCQTVVDAPLIGYYSCDWVLQKRAPWKREVNTASNQNLHDHVVLGTKLVELCRDVFQPREFYSPVCPVGYIRYLLQFFETTLLQFLQKLVEHGLDRVAKDNDVYKGIVL
jgi:hypothetical protein